jgi:hypothetical protein
MQADAGDGEFIVKMREVCPGELKHEVSGSLSSDIVVISGPQ